MNKTKSLGHCFRKAGGCMLAIGLMSSLSQGEEKPGKPAPVDLRELLKSKTEIPAFKATRLSPEWVGTLRGGKEPVNLRISHAGRWAKETAPGEKQELDPLWICRMGDRGRYMVSERANFVPTLPKTTAIKAAKNVAQLRGWLGEGQGAISGQSDGDMMYSTETWACFTQTAEGNLRWVGVFAYISWKGQDWKTPERVSVDELVVSEGILRPADPKSEAEAKLYPSAERLEAEEEEKKAARRAKIPEPLRSLIVADEAPNDSDMAIYAVALGKIRQNPEPLLFQQVSAFDDFGTGRSYLDDILLDQHFKVEPWTNENRAKALRYAAEALPNSHDLFKFQKQVETLMQVMGGGHLKLESPEVDLVVEVREGGCSTTWRDTMNEKNFREAAPAIVEWFKKKLEGVPAPGE